MIKKLLKKEFTASIITLAIIVIIFTSVTRGNFLSLYNLKILLDQAFPFLLGGAGMIFVISQGSIDLSVGANATLVGVLMSKLFLVNENVWLIFIVGILIGAIIGMFNGIIISYFKVPSFMVTIALLLGLKALVSAILFSGNITLTPLLKYDELMIKAPLILIVLAICFYVFRYTRLGYYVRYIGENELAVKFSGVNTTLYKTLGFVMSGAIAGLFGVISICRLGGVTPALASGFEIRSLMVLFLGGIAVHGGLTAKYPKIILGSVIVVMLENGLSIASVTSYMYQFVLGGILILIVVVTLFVYRKSLEAAMHESILQMQREAEKNNKNKIK